MKYSKYNRVYERQQVSQGAQVFSSEMKYPDFSLTSLDQFRSSPKGIFNKIITSLSVYIVGQPMKVHFWKFSYMYYAFPEIFSKIFPKIPDFFRMLEFPDFSRLFLTFPLWAPCIIQ